MNVSIVVPCYNAVDTLGETLRSVQAVDLIETIRRVVVIDDCSSDGSSELAHRVWTDPTPLIVHRFEQNLGQWTATNYGFNELARNSDWTIILHADDIMKPNLLSLYLEAFRAAPRSVATVCSSYDVWFSDEDRIEYGEELPGQAAVHVPGDRDEVRGTIERGCWWHISGCAIRNESFWRIGNFDSKLPMLGDWDWILRALSLGFGAWYLPRSTLLYRQLSTSVSGRSFRVAQDLRDRLAILRKFTSANYLSPKEHRRQVRGTLKQLTRRSFARIVRGDATGFHAHTALLVQTGACYLRGTL
jgi:glycosyltransferase involved in cell wall biosynthesis